MEELKINIPSDWVNSEKLQAMVEEIDRLVKNKDEHASVKLETNEDNIGHFEVLPEVFVTFTAGSLGWITTNWADAYLWPKLKMHGEKSVKKLKSIFDSQVE